MDYIEPEEFEFSCFDQQSHASLFIHFQALTLAPTGLDKETLSHFDIRDLLAKNETDFHDIKFKTRSIHGHRYFTAWEYIISCKPIVNQAGRKWKEEEAPLKKGFGRTLMW